VLKKPTLLSLLSLLSLPSSSLPKMSVCVQRVGLNSQRIKEVGQVGVAEIVEDPGSGAEGGGGARDCLEALPEFEKGFGVETRRVFSDV
jgi:hypothetical protein